MNNGYHDDIPKDRLSKMSANGQADTGGKGGRPRSAMRTIQKLVNAGDLLTDTDLEQCLAFARTIRDNEELGTRERLRANELIMTLMKHLTDKAVDLDKMERLEAGEATENTLNINVEYVSSEYDDDDDE